MPFKKQFGHATDEGIIWRMRIACWIPKATETDSEYVILIALPQQQWLHERGSLLRYMYIVCLVAFETQLIITQKLIIIFFPIAQQPPVGQAAS